MKNYQEIKLPDYILISISRVAIQNITTKQVTLITSNSQMSRYRVLWSCLGPAKISEMEWTSLIHTRRGWKVQMRSK